MYNFQLDTQVDKKVIFNWEGEEAAKAAVKEFPI